MSDGPEAYIQSAKDKWDEETNLEDRLNGVVGGNPRHLNWEYKAGIKVGDEYEEDKFDSKDDAFEWIQDFNEQENLGYNFESAESLLVEEKDW